MTVIVSVSPTRGMIDEPMVTGIAMAKIARAVLPNGTSPESCAGRTLRS
jgi:hypothetical protein